MHKPNRRCKAYIPAVSNQLVSLVSALSDAILPLNNNTDNKGENMLVIRCIEHTLIYL